jgi:hypothetical protein
MSACGHSGTTMTRAFEKHYCADQLAFIHERSTLARVDQTSAFTFSESGALFVNLHWGPLDQAYLSLYSTKPGETIDGKMTETDRWGADVHLASRGQERTRHATIDT